MKKNITVEKSYCDVCGQEADKNGLTISTYVNGEIKHEYMSDKNIDLCSEHLSLLERTWKQLPEKLVPDRYEPSYTDAEKKDMIAFLKQFEKEEKYW